MPLDFPSSPTLNENYSFGTKTWIWNGNAWALASSGAINSTPIGNLSPSTGAFTTLSATGNITVGNVISNGVSATGNITGTYFLGNGSLLTGIDATSIQSGTSNVRVQSSGGNVSIGVGGTAVVRFTSTGIVNDMGNGVGNIGNATGYFNTVFAKATSAQYADLAEKYLSDRQYPVGTVMIFGGTQEVTISGSTHQTSIAGIVSQNPSYIMNAGLTGDHTTMLALLGRVPCLVQGQIAKGDLLVSSEVPGVACRLDPSKYSPGCVIGKALVSHAESGPGVIEVVVGRL
jgi:hypothetical protein